MFDRAARFIWPLTLALSVCPPAHATSTWTGHTLADLFGDQSKISTKCGKETDRQADVDAFLTHMANERPRLAELLKSLAQDTKAVQDAEKTKIIKNISDAMVTEMKKINLTLTCAHSTGTLDMKIKAKNSKGTEITLIQA